MERGNKGEPEVVENLSLESIVSDAFASIALKYKYQLVVAKDHYVRLDSEATSIQVHYDLKRSYEVAVEFVELVDGSYSTKIPFNLGEVYRENIVTEEYGNSFFQSSDLHAVQRFLKSVAIVLETVCSEVLCGDRVFFEALNRRRSIEAATYTRQIQLRSILEEADIAWREKRLREFVNLLWQFRDILPIADQKKLDYAKNGLTTD